MDVSLPGQPVNAPQVAVAPDGAETVVWQRFNGLDATLVQSATRSVGGVFVTPVFLSTNGGSAVEPQPEIAGDGTTTVAWKRTSGTKAVIQASTRAAGATPFGAPVDLSDSGGNSGPRVASAADGTTTVVWTRDGVVQAGTRNPGGAFAPAVDVSASGQNAGAPQLAVAPDGTTTVVWVQAAAILASTRPPGGGFGAPVDLSGPSQSANSPRIAVARDGATTVVWSSASGPDTTVQAATRPPGGSFAAPVAITSSGSHFAPQVAVARDGATTIAWRRFADGHSTVLASTRAPGGGFTAPVDASTGVVDAGDPQLGVAPDGSATVIWKGTDGVNSIVQANTRPANGAFGRPVGLSAPGQNADAPALAVGPDGNAVVVWKRFNGATDVIQAVSTRPQAVPGTAAGSEAPASPKPAAVVPAIAWPQVGFALQRVRSRGPRIGLLRAVVASGIPAGASLVVTCPVACGARTGAVIARLRGAGRSRRALLRRPLPIRRATVVRVALVLPGRVGRFKTYGFQNARPAPRAVPRRQGCLKPGTRSRTTPCP